MSVANAMEPVAARKMKLGQLLVQEGLVSDQQLEEALHDQETTTPHKPLGEICVDAWIPFNKRIEASNRKISEANLVRPAVNQDGCCFCSPIG